MQVVPTLSLAYAPPWQARQLSMPGIKTSADSFDLRASWQLSHFCVTCLACVNFAAAYHTPDTRTGATCHVGDAAPGGVTLWHSAQPVASDAVWPAAPGATPPAPNRLLATCAVRSRAHASASAFSCCDSGGDPGRRRSCTMVGAFASR